MKRENVWEKERKIKLKDDITDEKGNVNKKEKD